jgi:hypothetical protein
MFASALMCLGTAVSILAVFEYLRPIREKDPYYI